MIRPGSTLGHYEIASAVGKGGMGEVWRARDSKLGRDVAIKTLPAEFASHRERLERLDHEARLLAALNHPNIASIHGLEEDQGTHFLVMELVEGESLDELIRSRGALSVEHALRLASQIADALVSAHARGVIHRDLKRANIKLSADGRVKVLDFGLAKLVVGPQTNTSETGDPVVGAVTTAAGKALGTPAYMSPEQVRGGAVDKRTDLWAFGCVLFELLTGQPAFMGASTTDVYASVLKSEPNWKLLPANTPPSVRRVLRRCLRKDVEHRMRDIGDAQLELEESDVDETAAPPPRLPRRLLALAIWPAALLVGAVALGCFSRFGLQPEEDDELRFELGTPVTSTPEEFAVSPDGWTVASVGQSADGTSRLWLKEIGSLSQRELPGTEGAQWPFWSKDSDSIMFYADDGLKKFDLATQSVQVLIDRLGGQMYLGGSLNADNVLLTTVSYTGPIIMFQLGPVGVSGVRPVTKLDVTREIGHAFPHFLPDGNHFLYFVNSNVGMSGTYLGSLDGSVSKRLLPSDSVAVYSEPGRLLFMRGDKLYAQGFDLEALSLIGDPFIVTDAAVVNRLGSGGVSASLEGTIVYRTDTQSGHRQFVWRDSQGRELERVGEPMDGNLGAPELTANSDGIVFHRLHGSANLDLWLLEFSRGTPSRITLEEGNEWNAIVSPVDDTLVYGEYALSTARRGQTQLYTKPLSSNVQPGKPLLETMANKRPMGYSSDGRTILFATGWEPGYLDRLGIELRSGWDIWAMALDGSGNTFPVAYSAANEWNAQFSPDQKWIAFESDESGNVEIYLQSYPDADVKKKVSPNGGAQPIWLRDGDRQYLYFVGLDKMLYRTLLIEGAELRELTFGPAEPLFVTNIVAVAPQDFLDKQQYVIESRDRILVNEPTASSEPLRVIKRWVGAPTPE